MAEKLEEEIIAVYKTDVVSQENGILAMPHIRIIEEQIEILDDMGVEVYLLKEQKEYRGIHEQLRDSLKDTESKLLDERLKNSRLAKTTNELYLIVVILFIMIGITMLILFTISKNI